MTWKGPSDMTYDKISYDIRIPFAYDTPYGMVWTERLGYVRRGLCPEPYALSYDNEFSLSYVEYDNN